MPADRLHRALRALVASAMSAAVIGLLGCASAPTTRTNARSGESGLNIPDPVGRLSPGQAQDVTLYAMTLVGTPYRYGGNTPEGGFDCSGLIGHVYQKNSGLAAPRTTTKLKSWGNPVALDNVRMGDLVVFLNSNNTANHAGIYVGSNRFVHAPSTGGVVRLDSLAGKYWASQTVVVRRP